MMQGRYVVIIKDGFSFPEGLRGSEQWWDVSIGKIAFVDCGYIKLTNHYSDDVRSKGSVIDALLESENRPRPRLDCIIQMPHMMLELTPEQFSKITGEVTT